MITTKIILVCSSGFNLLKPRTLKCFDSVFHLCDTAADICGKYQDRLFHGAFLRFLDNCKWKIEDGTFLFSSKKGATIISHFYSWDISIDSQHRPPYISYSLSLKNFMSYHVVFRKLYFFKLFSSHKYFVFGFYWGRKRFANSRDELLIHHWFASHLISCQKKWRLQGLLPGVS